MNEKLMRDFKLCLSERALLYLVVALFMTMSPAYGAILIDNFATLQSSSGTAIDPVAGSGMIGNSREVLLAGLDDLTPEFLASGGIGTFSNIAGATNASAFLFYDGIADGLVESPPVAGGLGGIDLLGGELFVFFRFDVASVVGTVAFQGGLFNPLTGTFDYYSSTFVVGGINAPGSYTAGLEVGPSALGNSADMIAIRISSLSPGESISFSAIGIGAADEPLPSGVPLPGALVLLISGIGALGFGRRKWARTIRRQVAY